jgi:hypothetical protein
MVLLGAIAVIHPAGEIPLGDEITYARSAQLLAQTGHIHYIGWINAIGGWQLYWGAAAIRLFGGSYWVLRWSMAVAAAATTFLLHRCLSRVGVTPVLAAAGTLMFCLSPLFLSTATSFLTDVPGVFAVLVCLYACLRALKAKDVRATLIWMGVATVGNSILGSSRQYGWLAALVMVPSLLWLLRRHRTVVWAGTGLWLLSLGMDCAMQYWFMHQPYTDREPTLGLGITPHRVQIMCLEGLDALLAPDCCCCRCCWRCCPCWCGGDSLRPARSPVCCLRWESLGCGAFIRCGRLRFPTLVRVPIGQWGLGAKSYWQLSMCWGCWRC